MLRPDIGSEQKLAHAECARRKTVREVIRFDKRMHVNVLVRVVLILCRNCLVPGMSSCV